MKKLNSAYLSPILFCILHSIFQCNSFSEISWVCILPFSHLVNPWCHSFCLNFPDQILDNSYFCNFASIVSEIVSILHSSSRPGIYGLSLWEKKGEKFQCLHVDLNRRYPEHGAEIKTTQPPSFSQFFVDTQQIFRTKIFLTLLA